jgi:hypothetical protein
MDDDRFHIAPAPNILLERSHVHRLKTKATDMYYALAWIAFGGAPLAVVPGKKSFDSRGSRAIDQLSWELPGRHRVQ